MQLTQTSPPIAGARTYHTMTVGGVYGTDIDACTDEQAEATAKRLGYDVLDVFEDPTLGRVLVVTDDDYCQPESPEAEAFWAAEAARGELAGAPDELPCYECGGFDGVTAPSRKVVALGPVTRRPDPWQTFRLECGHTAI